MKIQWMAGKTYTLRAEIVETLESKPSGQPQSINQSVNLTQDYQISVSKDPNSDGRQLQLTFTGETMDVSQGGRKVSSFDSKQDVAQDASDPMAPCCESCSAHASNILPPPMAMWRKWRAWRN